jgi:hypothetical protein
MQNSVSTSIARRIDFRVMFLGMGLLTAACATEDGLSPSSPAFTEPVESIEITTLPAKLEYELGEEVRLSGGILTVHLANGTSEAIALRSVDQLTVTNVPKVATPKFDIPVTFRGKSAVYSVKVLKRAATITMATQPTTTAYVVGDSIRPDGARINVNYNDGSTGIVDVTTAMITPKVAAVAGSAVTVTLDKGTTTFNITVKDVSSVAMLAQPTKTGYEVSEVIDPAGATITVTYSDASTAVVPVTAAMLTPKNAQATPTAAQTITVTYKTKTTTFDISVKEATSIAVTTPPTTTSYTVNQVIDPAGATITVTYSDASTEVVPVTAAMLTPKNAQSTPVAAQTITVGHKGRTATFDIAVVPAP